jgi:hypothetical protein
VSPTGLRSIWRAYFARLWRFAGALFLLSLTGLLITQCVPVQVKVQTAASREEAIKRIALAYAQDHNLIRARAALGELQVPDPPSAVSAQAERSLTNGATVEVITALAVLAGDLGARSDRLALYLPANQVPSPAPVPSLLPEPSATLTFTPTPTASAIPSTPTPTATDIPPSATPRLTPAVEATGTANLRGGPGTVYPVIGQLRGGQELDIVGRDTSGQWWQVSWSGTSQAWVASSVVQAVGGLTSVQVAKEIPPVPATPTPAATSTPTGPTATPTFDPSKAPYRIIEQRLLTKDDNGSCQGGHSIFIQVIDAKGGPVNGAVIRRVTLGEDTISGVKDCRWHLGVPGEGCAEFPIYGNGDRITLVADPERGAVTVEVSRHLSAQDIDIPNEDLIAGGYCADPADCDLRKRPPYGKPQLCNGHYSWIVRFQRAW